jgi:hypothetical protein
MMNDGESVAPKEFPQDQDGEANAPVPVTDEVKSIPREEVVYKKSDLQMRKKEELLEIASTLGLEYDGTITKRVDIITGIVNAQAKKEQPAVA